MNNSNNYGNDFEIEDDVEEENNINSNNNQKIKKQKINAFYYLKKNF